MHRVARELAHQECGWKHSEGHGVVALDYEGVRHVGLDKMCLLMEVRMRLAGYRAGTMRVTRLTK
jgi:hypothetical protein